MSEVCATLSPTHSIQLLALGVMVRDGELEIAGADAAKAREVLVDVSQEIALQMGAEGRR